MTATLRWTQLVQDPAEAARLAGPGFESWSMPRGAAVDRLRALLAQTAVIGFALAQPGIVPSATGGEGRDAGLVVVRPELPREPERAMVFSQFMGWPAALRSLTDERASDAPPLRDFTTRQGAVEAAAVPVLGIVAVIAAAGGLAWCAYHAATVVDRQLQRVERTRVFVATQTRCLTALGAHTVREQVAGRALPFDVATLAACSTAKAAQDAALAPERPFVTDSGAGSGVPWVPIAIGAGLYLALS